MYATEVRQNNNSASKPAVLLSGVMFISAAKTLRHYLFVEQPFYPPQPMQ
jgi:hypothetical protein